jgi:hypothetical protein
VIECHSPDIPQVDNVTALFYFTTMAANSQQHRQQKLLRASLRQRATAAVTLLAAAAFFATARMAATGRFDVDRWIDPCGFKQAYGLPCPTCGMVTAVTAFARGDVVEAFYVQPAAGLLCCALAAAGFFAFATAVLGVYFWFLERLFGQVRPRHWILYVAIVIAAGWAVTLARALAARGQ